MILKPKDSFKGVDISEIRKMNALAGPDTINLGIGQLPNELPKAVMEQGQRAFELGVTRYTSNQGLPELRELVASFHSKKTGKEIDANQVVITNGAEGALWNILYTFLEPTDEVLIPEISFSVYKTITDLQNSKTICYKNIDSIEALITKNTKFVIINSPNNPTGQIIGEEDIKKLGLLANKYNFYIISDEIYSELYLDGVQPVSPLKYSDRVILVDGISKRAAATGLRIGWTVSPLKITKPMIISNQYISTCASSVSQFAAIKSLDGSSDIFVEDIKKDLAIKRDYAYATLSSINGLNVEKPQGAFYIFPEISAFGKSKEVALKILELADVLTIPGIAFGIEGDKYIRLSYAVEFKELETALNRLKEIFENWSSYESK